MIQLSLVESEPTPSLWTSSDDWETPDWLAQKMAGLVQESDRRILEPSAGTGQIAKRLPMDREITALEINHQRELKLCFEAGIDSSPTDFLTITWVKHPFDLIITNPPFSLAIEFLAQSLKLLNPENPNARVAFLLPTTFLQSKGRYQAFKGLNCHIHQEFRIAGRVAYLKDGKPVKGRQCEDSVFVFKPGSVGNSTIDFWEAP